MSTGDWSLEQGAAQVGRTAVVTGANTGVGLEVARGLAMRGATVVLACRNTDAAAQARLDILGSAPEAKVDVVRLDVSDLASVRSCADELRAGYPVIDILVNNAGVMHQTRQVTADGFEGDFGTNFLGPFALTGLLLDQVLASPAGRIIAVSSKTHRSGVIAFEDLQSQQSFAPTRAYTQSKLAQLMATYELQRRLERAGSAAIALAAHPGGTRTSILREQSGAVRWVFNSRFRFLTGWFTQGPAQGALPMLRAATDPDAAGGQFYGPGGRFEQIGPPVLVRAAGRACDPDSQLRLWQAAEELTGVSYSLTRDPA
ncbi:oxidoreductase [Mycolicibacter arupensis]|jgi:NAD(P)-dependent dehydrogenase (short-subunit alcohol dehydrogenase family)|uniref:Short-chain dehydrogenase n=1 Tax=Mycolicibacter arupensis TaxID=342002 RepID=A0A0F5MZ22_9MYCO|nr:oxidoreductase [Mycolicibacter arupensis]KKC00021.1 short-chain dehydrogenase [Mycolicibacter arupensis]MCV7274652.1 SDR family NAD(P)-dependent oxidoreductase [Mycolicibacter arupensis]OQZ97516.1 short-chain dehydrogenase [Mycolicibacter arupensis]